MKSILHTQKFTQKFDVYTNRLKTEYVNNLLHFVIDIHIKISAVALPSDPFISAANVIWSLSKVH